MAGRPREKWVNDVIRSRRRTQGGVRCQIWRLFTTEATEEIQRGLLLCALWYIRDQLSIPRRGITSEEVLLRLRRLRSGYEYDFQLGLTYTFGSIFNTIVNPRFGR
jgi:hypothetical protein